VSDSAPCDCGALEGEVLRKPHASFCSSWDGQPYTDADMAKFEGELPKLLAPTTHDRRWLATVRALRAERQDALLSAMGHEADADRLAKQVEELERILDRAAEAGRTPTKRLLEITATLDRHYLNAPLRKELEDAIYDRDWLVDQLGLANADIQSAKMAEAVLKAEAKELRECLALAVGALGEDSPLKLKPPAFERFAAALGRKEAPDGG